MRVRRAFLDERLVPYAIAGIGPSFLQFNDAKFAGYGRQIDIEGVTFAVAAGAGLEYFFADNLTFGIESRYMWIRPIEGTVDGDPVEVDMSSPLFTFGLRAYFSQNDPEPLVTRSDPRKRLYFGVRVGGSLLTDGELTSGVDLDPEVSAVGSTVNETGGLALGVDFRAPWGIELEADSLEQSIDMDGTGRLGEYGMGIVIPQLRLRSPIGPGRWVPYWTGGVGIGYGEVNDRTEAGTTLGVSAKGIHPALSIGGGLEYFVVSNLSLNADLRWIYTWGHEIQVGNGPTASGDISALMLTVGFRAYLFDL
jgi:opacity protein-like surface antigen